MKLCFALFVSVALTKAAFVGDTFDSSIGIPSQSTKSSDDTNDDSIVFEKIKFPNTGAATSKRYHIVPYLKSNWLLANMYCNKIGMRSIGITSMEEQNAIAKTIKSAGLTESLFWTTGRRVDSTMYWFATGTKLNFTNWGQDEPYNRHTMQECVGIYAQSEQVKLQWTDVECNESLRIICENDEF